MMNPFKLDAYLREGLIDDKLHRLIKDFHESYIKASKDPKNEEIFGVLIQLIIEQIKNPYTFSIFHQSMRSPFDYYQFGLDFIRPFIDFSKSKVLGLENLKKIQSQLNKNENVILFANHQIEPDPQIISLLLDKIDSQLAEKMIFFAGHRVTTDPMAVPLSLGRNLLCIYSKKHMDNPPEEKQKKVLHNQKTLKQTLELLNQGGQCIYIAPSGGRDRPNGSGIVSVSPFDQQSIELFRLLGIQASNPTHYYPLALHTYPLMPPPKKVEQELGEKRIVQYTPVSLNFGEEIDMEHFPGSENLDKKAKKKKRCEYILGQVCKAYKKLI